MVFDYSTHTKVNKFAEENDDEMGLKFKVESYNIIIDKNLTNQNQIN